MKTPQEKKFDIFIALSKAINEREQLHMKYRESGEWRLIKPCRLGISSGKDGTILLGAIQEDGESESGKSTGWKFFDIEKIKEVRLTGRKFEFEESGKAQGASKFRRLFCSVFASDQSKSFL